MSLGAPDFTPRRAARGNPDRKDRPMPKMPEIGNSWTARRPQRSRQRAASPSRSSSSRSSRTCPKPTSGYGGSVASKANVAPRPDRSRHGAIRSEERIGFSNAVLATGPERPSACRARRLVQSGETRAGTVEDGAAGIVGRGGRSAILRAARPGTGAAVFFSETITTSGFLRYNAPNGNNPVACRQGRAPSHRQPRPLRQQRPHAHGSRRSSRSRRACANGAGPTRS